MKNLISIDELIGAIESSKVTKEILVESRDYYARRGDYSTDYITYVDAHELVSQLIKMKE